MAYRVHQVNKKSGVTYVYEATSGWDKEKKQPRNRQVCIGKLDPKTGEFIPSKRLDPRQAAAWDPAVTATAVVVGPALLLDRIRAELELDQVLQTSFPDAGLIAKYTARELLLEMETLIKSVIQAGMGIS